MSRTRRRVRNLLVIIHLPLLAGVAAAQQRSFTFDREAYRERALTSEQPELDDVTPGENWVPREEQIVNGNPTFGFSAAGALLIGAVAESASIRCSGTMIGCGTFLTANHCVAGFRNPSEYHVFLQSDGILPVKTISDAHDEYNPPYADLVVLTLDRTVEATTPTPLNTSESGADTGSGEIVGFGHTGLLFNDHGIKRTGVIETVPCDDSEEGLICWDFDAELSSTTCHVDSGGPLLFRDAEGTTLLGGVSSRTDAQCDEGFQSKDVDVTAFVDWIEQKGGRDVGNLACGSGGSRLLQSNKGFRHGERILSPGSSEEHVYLIPDAARRIRVALNGQDAAELDFDLAASIRQADATVSGSCSEDAKGNFAFCEFDVTDDDAFVQATVSLTGDYEASYQLTVTAL